ncbi:ribosome biogenesis protein Nop16 [Colletotrichum fioriniae PJ7]|uniref:Nucleolar protein 16 n=1 Tax=Colletotrichum fioriniae PJ7 TaxID=1445577 RepID=A0A010RXD9_9PEZI|nr:ribosome biogenesis protein Nop16 [Colletotrichum fioriniae PJ7]
MGSVLQKKKRRSGRAKVKTNRPKKLLNPLGNDIIAKNWYADIHTHIHNTRRPFEPPALYSELPLSRNEKKPQANQKPFPPSRNKKETLTQNYRRLGLTARLKSATGGTEKTLAQLEQAKTASASAQRDPFAISTTEEAVFEEARVERDADGKIIKIHYASANKRPNPLNDPLNALEEDSDDGEEGAGAENEEEWGGIDDESRPEVIRLLEKEAALPEIKKPRHISQQEKEWLERLIAKHGDDYDAMVRDRKLNPMQQTRGDIARRVKRFTGKV